MERLLPAAAAGEFGLFSEALFDFGCLAGSCFAKNQGGLFASPLLCHLVETVRRLGVRGVGQSSWGPTLFALCESDEAAQRFCAALRRETSGIDLELTITPPDNYRARIVRQAL